MVADVDLLVVQKHAVDSLDGSFSGLGGLVMDETVALGSTLVIGGDLAGQNVPEGGERIVQSLSTSGQMRQPGYTKICVGFEGAPCYR